MAGNESFDSLSRHVPWYADAVESAIHGDKPDSVFTGFSRPGSWHWALPHGQVTLIAGRPGSGKTGLLLSLVRHASWSEQRPTVFLTAELPAREAAVRLISGATGLTPRAALAAGKLDLETWAGVPAALERLDDAPLLLICASDSGLDDLRAVMFGHDVELLAVDGLGLLRPASSPGDRLRELRLLVRDRGTAAVATLSLPAAAEPPTLEDIQAAGIDLSVADQIVVLHVGDGRQAPDQGRDDALDLEAWVLKDRTAAAGCSILLEWDGDLAEPRPRLPGRPW